jgi:hypothetical protein
MRSVASALDASGGEVLSLVDAAAECGYSADHLGRLVRSGQLPNSGRRKAPKIRRRDLPKKPASLPESPPVVHRHTDRTRIAESVLSLSQKGA